MSMTKIDVPRGMREERGMREKGRRITRRARRILKLFLAWTASALPVLVSPLLVLNDESHDERLRLTRAEV